MFENHGFNWVMIFISVAFISTAIVCLFVFGEKAKSDPALLPKLTSEQRVLPVKEGYSELKIEADRYSHTDYRDYIFPAQIRINDSRGEFKDQFENAAARQGWYAVNGSSLVIIPRSDLDQFEALSRNPTQWVLDDLACNRSPKALNNLDTIGVGLSIEFTGRQNALMLSLLISMSTVFIFIFLLILPVNLGIIINP